MKYKFTINDQNEFRGMERNEYEPGERVEFTVPFVTDVHTSVTSGDVSLEQVDGAGSYDLKFAFMMPEKDVNVSVTMTSNMSRTMPQQPVHMGQSPVGMMGMMGMMGAANESGPKM